MPEHHQSPKSPSESPDIELMEDGSKKLGQFKISTLLSWTAVICFLIYRMRLDTMFQSIDGNIQGPGSGADLVFFAIFITPPFTCVPFLIDRLLMKKNGLNFNLFWRIWLMLCLGVYSMLMLMVATVAFDATWKGTKGLHWFYYTLDKQAGMSLWPIYCIGVSMFVAMLFNPQKASRSRFLFLGPATCAAISFWYFFATAFLNFTENQGDNLVFVIVPGGTAVCYGLYCLIVLRNRESTFPTTRATWMAIAAWYTGLLFSICIKIPLAKRIYDELPDDMPESCFVVTAATRGHQIIVGTWFDSGQNRLLNHQLLTFWEFEDWFGGKFPSPHRLLRIIYNSTGPRISKCIVFRWQADLVYVLLKPAELTCRICLENRRN